MSPSILPVLYIMINTHQLKSGLRVVTEHNPSVSTVALNWAVPAGVATNDQDGSSVIISEMVLRGANGLSAREHNESLELLGVRKHVTCGNEYFFVSGVMLGSVFEEAFRLLSGYILNPLMPESELLACKQLCLQSLSGLADDPALQAKIALNTYHYPAPFNRTGYGDKEVLEHGTIADLSRVLQDRFLPDGSIIALSGNIQHEEAVAVIESETVDWSGTPKSILNVKKPLRGSHWIQHDSSQVHIGIAMDAPNMQDKFSLYEAIATTAFGGTTSGRLFAQVRQRRSLVYSVGAQYAASKDRSSIKIHAGTTPARAPETIEVCLDQLEELKKGITQSEFDRVVRRMKSQIVMRGESTAARASAIWADSNALSKARTLQDKLDEIDGVRLSDVNDWLAARIFGKLTLVTLGPEELRVNPDQLTQH